MDTAGECLPHVQQQLGVYVLGALPPAEAAAVDRHLDTCVSCTELAIGLANAGERLGRLEPADIASLVGPASRLPAGRSGAPGRPPDRGRRGPGPERPPTRQGRPRRRRGALAGLVVTVLALVAAGLGIGLALQPTETALAGTETSQQTGASMTVTVRGSDRACHIETEISGLTPQVAYRLHVIEANGSSRVAAEFTAIGPRQAISAEVALAARSVASVSVTTVDGRAVVSVRVTPTPG